MAGSRTYNSFYKWIQQDDYLTNWANFIEGSNVTGLTTWYWITLWIKSEKQLLTNGSPLSIWAQQLLSWALTRMFIWDDDWNLYRGDATDNVPDFTQADVSDPNRNAYVNMIKFWTTTQNTWLFFRKDITWTSTSISVDRIIASPIEWARPLDFSAYEYTFDEISHIDNPPLLVYWSVLYIASWFWDIRRYTESFVTTNFNSLIDDYAAGMTLQGTQIKIYSKSGNVYFWDGSGSNITSYQSYPFRISSVIQQGQFDYITAEGGDMYISSGYSYEKIINSQTSKRLNDNSWYKTKLNFEKTANAGIPLQNWSWFLYAASNDDSVKWIYKYGELIKWLPKGFHKEVTTNHLFQDFTQVNSLKEYSRTLKRMFYWWTSSMNYWVDYIEFKGNDTQRDGYAVTDIFTWWTTLTKQIDKFRITTSYTSWDNYVKLYCRKDNNSTWELARNINRDTDIIHRSSITEITWNFVDIQFKIELHNEDQGSNPPIVHEIYLEYTVNKNNG